MSAGLPKAAVEGESGAESLLYYRCHYVILQPESSVEFLKNRKMRRQGPGPRVALYRQRKMPHIACLSCLENSTAVSGEELGRHFELQRRAGGKIGLGGRPDPLKARQRQPGLLGKAFLDPPSLNSSWANFMAKVFQTDDQGKGFWNFSGTSLVTRENTEKNTSEFSPKTF